MDDLQTLDALDRAGVEIMLSGFRDVGVDAKVGNRRGGPVSEKSFASHAEAARWCIEESLRLYPGILDQAPEGGHP